MLAVSDFGILKTYLDGVMYRAQHHSNVAAAALAVAGGVMWRAEKDSLKCRTYNNHTANILWFRVGQREYAIAYNHGTGQIELSNRTTGRHIAGFDDATPSVDILAVFRTL
jgi:hypothetical protein